MRVLVFYNKQKVTQITFINKHFRKKKFGFTITSLYKKDSFTRKFTEMLQQKIQLQNIEIRLKSTLNFYKMLLYFNNLPII